MKSSKVKQVPSAVFQGITTTMWWERKTSKGVLSPQEPEKKIKWLARCESVETEPTPDPGWGSGSPWEPWQGNIRTSMTLFPNVTVRAVFSGCNSKSMSPLRTSFLKTTGDINQCCEKCKLGKSIGQDKRTLSSSGNVSIAKPCPPAGLQSTGLGMGGGVWVKQTGSFLCLWTLLWTVDLPQCLAFSNQQSSMGSAECAYLNKM